MFLQGFEIQIKKQQQINQNIIVVTVKNKLHMIL